MKANLFQIVILACLCSGITALVDRHNYGGAAGLAVWTIAMWNARPDTSKVTPGSEPEKGTS